MHKARNLITILAALGGAGLITNSAGAATRTWTAAGTDTNWSTAANWSATPLPGDDLKFNTNGSSVALITNNVVDNGFTTVPRSLMYGQTNACHGTLITGPGLTITGTGATPNPLFVGTGDDGVITVTNLTAFFGTTLSVNNPASPIIVRQAGSGGSGSPNHRATLDMSRLGNFNATVLGLYTGWENDGLLSDRRPCGTVFFARTNNITCTAIGLGFVVADVVQQAGGASLARLGQANSINVNSMRIGGAKANGTLNFNTGLINPTVTFRNAAGIGRQSTWYIGDDATGGSSSASTGLLDLSGGSVDALVGTIYVGRGQSGTGGDGNGTLTMKSGIIDVDTLEVGYQIYAGDSVGRGTVRVDGGLLKVNRNIRLGRVPTGTSTDIGSGVLIVNSGTVRVAGNILNGGATSAIVVTNNGTLDLQPAGDATPGNLSVGKLTIGAGTVTNYNYLSASNVTILAPASEFTVYPGQTLEAAGAGIAGSLTVTTNLILNNANLAFDLGGLYDQIIVQNALTLSGLNTVSVNPITGFGAGTYPIMTYATTLTGSAGNLKLGGAIADSRYTVSFDTATPSVVNLTVAGGPAASLTWNGDGSANLWDVNGALNWDGGAGAKTEKFYNLDTVNFDDTGSASPAVNLVGTLLPSSVNVSGSKNYTFAGSGKISGSCGLNLNSTGTLTILTTNDYTYNTTINPGSTLQLGNGTTADGAVGMSQIDNNGALILNAAGYQLVAGAITGSGTMAKRGPGITQLGGDNFFTAALTNEAGTLMAGSATALGDISGGTTILPGTTLDFGGYSIGAEPVFVSGTGIAGQGAIINSGPTAGGLRDLRLLGDTTFGGSSSWTVGGNSASEGLQANSNKVTKISSNNVQISGGSVDNVFTGDPGLGDLDIQAGTFTFYGFVGLGDPAKSITVRSNATLQLNCTGDYLTAKPIVFENGASLVSTLPNRLMPQYCTVPGPVTLNGVCSVRVVGTDLLNILGEVTGAGSLVCQNAGMVMLNASNTFTGNLEVQAGTVALTNDSSVTAAANIILSTGTIDVTNRVDGTLTLADGQTLSGVGAIVGSLGVPTGATVSPGASVGAIAVSSNVTLRGTTVIELRKTSWVPTADQIIAGGTIDLGGSLNVTYSGDTLVTGDVFTIFTAGTLANAFTNVVLPSITGVVWTNKTAINGAIEVLSAPALTAPDFTGVQQRTDGNFDLLFSGPQGAPYSVRASTDITAPGADWTVLTSGLFGGGPTNYIDLTATNFAQRFYRITIP